MSSSLPLLKQAVELAEKGQKQQAIQLCQQILDLEKMHGETAEFAARLLVKIIPQNAQAQFFHAAVLHYNDKHDDAYRCFERAVSLAPNDKEIHYHFSSLLTDMGEIKMALEHIDVCLLGDESNLDYLLARARLLVDSQEFDEAEKLVEHIIERSGNNSSHIFVFLGNIAAERNDDEKAFECYLQALEKDPNNINIYYNLGNVLFRMERDKEAIEYWKRMVEVHNENINSKRHYKKNDAKNVVTIIRVLKTYGVDYDLPGIEIYNSQNLDTIEKDSSLYGDNEGAVLFLEDVRTFSDEWFLINGRDIYANFVFHLAKNNTALKTISDNGRVLMAHHKPVKHYDSPVILFGGADNYYHWVCDYLPRLSLIENESSIRNVPILVNNKWMPYQQRSLELMGFDMTRIEKVPKDHELQFDQVYLPHFYNRPLKKCLQPDWHVPMMTLKRVNWLRDAYKDYIKPQQDKRRRIFVARKSSMRMCDNEEAVYKVAKQYDFEYIDNAELSFQEQIELYASAETVMGVHGAGFTNMVFAPRDAILIELYPKGNLPEFYTHLTKIIGQKHRGIEGRITRKYEGMIPSTWDFEVNCKEVQKTLDELFG